MRDDLAIEFVRIPETMPPSRASGKITAMNACHGTMTLAHEKLIPPA
jgi:hypothetical protein